MPPEAAARSAVMAETMLPAAPVMRNTRVPVERESGLAVGGRLLFETDGPPQAVVVADLDGAGIVQSLPDQEFGDFGRPSRSPRNQRLSPCVGALALVRLGEAGDGSAERATAPALS